MKLIPDSSDVNKKLVKLFSEKAQEQVSDETTQLYDVKNTSTEAGDEYKDMIIEMHRFANRHKSSYNWKNI